MHVKGLEMVCFEPRSQTNLALGYAVAPIGPRYDICEHDWDFDTEVGWEHTLTLSRTIGILKRVPMNRIGPEKVRYFKALFTLWSAADALDLCIFAIAPTRIFSLPEMAEMVLAVMGWEFSSHEMMKIGERRRHSCVGIPWRRPHGGRGSASRAILHGSSRHRTSQRRCDRRNGLPRGDPDILCDDGLGHGGDTDGARLVRCRLGAAD